MRRIPSYYRAARKPLISGEVGVTPPDMLPDFATNPGLPLQIANPLRKPLAITGGQIHPAAPVNPPNHLRILRKIVALNATSLLAEPT